VRLGSSAIPLPLPLIHNTKHNTELNTMNEPEIPLTYGVPVAFNEPGHGKIYQNAGRIVPRGQDRPINEASIQALEKQGFTRGLIEALLRDTENFAHRFWIIDNSGSMAMPDGLRLAETAKNHAIKFVKCTRWQEMQQTIEAQCVLAAQLEIPTNFCLLNDPGRQVGPQRFGIAENRADYSDLAVAQSTMRNAGPHGVTPFTQHLKAIKTEIAAMEPELRRDGTKVVVVIATDGLPSDESSYSTPGIQKEFVETLRSLERYPVWVVIRLFTDEDDIVDYYNDLDSQLELSLEVLGKLIDPHHQPNVKHHRSNSLVLFPTCYRRFGRRSEGNVHSQQVAELWTTIASHERDGILESPL
jgi:hypothetical protein